MSPNDSSFLLHAMHEMETEAPVCTAYGSTPDLSLTAALSPIVAWLALVLYGTLNPLSAVGGLSIKRSLKELRLERTSRLNVLDIFRVLAILWVMMNHTGSEGRIDILERLPSAETFKKNVHEHPIFGAFLGNSALGVEVFLVLSGLLAAKSWLRNADAPFLAHYSQFISRRLFRLLPSMILFVYIASGPIMNALLPRFYTTMISSCGIRGLLSHVFFVSNWQETPTCLGYLWYLGLDMQLYIIAPFFLHMMHRCTRRIALVGVAATVLISAVLRAGYCIGYDVCNKSDVDIPFISYPDADPEKIKGIYAGLWEMYARPYTKCGPFVIGLLFGWMSNLHHDIRLTETQSRTLFGASAALAVATIFAILPEYWWPDMSSNVYNVLYTATFRTVFSVAIVGMMAALIFRQQIVSIKPIWSVLARLTFNAYLLHMPVVYVFNYLPFLQTAHGAYELLAVLPAVAALSFAVAVVFYLFVEAPIGHFTSQIEIKIVFHPAAQPQPSAVSEKLQKQPAHSDNQLSSSDVSRAQRG